MKKAALFVTAALLLALVAPVFAQPFADVPTDHWAYDAIAELAAKGLVEGYPDGTFKGDRALTRYEMAMIVARLLARIEAVAAQIPGPPPPPPAPEVRRADVDALQRDISALRSSIDTINRLVREFQTDLQALGVRIESIEEELRNLRGQLDKTKVTGDFYGEYTSAVVGVPDVFTSPVTYFRRIRLTARGQIAPNVAGVLRVRAYNQDSVEKWDFDRLYLDVNNVLGVLNFRLGLQTISFGPYGLLLNQDGLNTRRDAFKVSTSVGGISLTAAAIRHDASTQILTGRVSFGFIPGWPLGVNFRSDSALGTVNTGLGLDLTGSLWAGVTLNFEYMTWTPSSGTASPSYQAGLGFNFSELTGTEMAFSPTMNVWYKNFGVSVPPAHTLASDWDANIFGDITAWGADLSLQVTPATSFTVSYETGNRPVAGTTYSLVDATVEHSLAQNTTLGFTYRTTSGDAFDNYTFYRVYLKYSW